MSAVSARAIEALAAEGVEAVAIGFLHSFTNPAHEHRVGDAVARALPDVAVTLSSDVSPEMREYERFSTACANAYLQPSDRPLLGQSGARPAAGRLSLSAATDDLRWRHHQCRNSHSLSRPPCRIRTGGRSDLCVLRRAPERPRRSRIVRYGRHDRKDLSDRQGAAADRARFRGGAHLPFSQRQRAALAHSGDRNG